MAVALNTAAVLVAGAVVPLILTTPMKRNRAEVRSLVQAAAAAVEAGVVVVLKI
jgi:hypothetical protein